MKKIAITMRQNTYGSYLEPVSSISDDWMDFFHLIGFMPVLVHNNIEDPVTFFKDNDCSGLLLSNGDNPEISVTNDIPKGTKRDIVEYKLLTYCVSKSLPVLGVCRGHQFINLYFGGFVERVNSHVAVEHNLDILGQKYIKFFNSSVINRNSYHNLAVPIAGIAQEMTPWAVIHGVVEGMSHIEYPILTIQWHPERSTQSSENGIDILMIKNHFLGKFED